MLWWLIEWVCEIAKLSTPQMETLIFMSLVLQQFLYWGEEITCPQFQIFFLCCTDKNATLKSTTEHQTRQLTSFHSSTWVWGFIFEESIMPKGTAYHLKISCRPCNTGITRIVQFRIKKTHCPEIVTQASYHLILDCVNNQVRCAIIQKACACTN